MADLLNDYYKKLQTLNQQRSMTGNQSYNQGIDASLSEGYFDAQQKNRQSQEALDLQKQTQTGYLDIAKQSLTNQTQNQAWQQAYSEKQLSNQQGSATTNLFGQAIGGAANLLTMNKYIDKLGGTKAPTIDQTPGATPDVTAAPLWKPAGDASADKFGAQPDINADYMSGLYSGADTSISDIFMNQDTNVSATDIFGDIFNW